LILTGGTKLSEVTPVESKIESSVEAEVSSVITKRFDGMKNRDETAVRAIFDERYNKFDDWPPFIRQEAEEALKNEFGAFKVLWRIVHEHFSRFPEGSISGGLGKPSIDATQIGSIVSASKECDEKVCHFRIHKCCS